MAKTILLVEDIEEMADLYRSYFEAEDIKVNWVPSAEEALELAKSQVWDLVVLDLNLPGLDGFEFLKRFRQDHNEAVMILSARSADEDVIVGLRNGADDFVSKPCPPKVLLARAQAHLRRKDKLAEDGQNLVCFGPYTLDREALFVKKNGTAYPLTVKEIAILDRLVAAGGEPLTPDSIYRSVWQQEYGDPGAVGVYIQRLRQKFEIDPLKPEYLQTLHGQGYRFNPVYLKKD